MIRVHVYSVNSKCYEAIKDLGRLEHFDDEPSWWLIPSYW